jgi:hypothetical protein
MKHLFFLVALSVSLILSGCSNTVEDISPLSPNVEEPIQEFDKAAGNTSFPFKLYQTFPELTGAKINWLSTNEGLAIKVDMVEASRRSLLFGVIELMDAESSGSMNQMVYLGNSSKGEYLVGAIKNRRINSVKIYVCNSIDIKEQREPYPQSYLFKSININGWAAADDAVKVSSENFSNRLGHLFAELIVIEGNELIFLGKPRSEDFEFPKSPKQTLTNVRLFGYINPLKSAHPVVSL